MCVTLKIGIDRIRLNVLHIDLCLISATYYITFVAPVAYLTIFVTPVEYVIILVTSVTNMICYTVVLHTLIGSMFSENDISLICQILDSNVEKFCLKKNKPYKNRIKTTDVHTGKTNDLVRFVWINVKLVCVTVNNYEQFHSEKLPVEDLCQKIVTFEVSMSFTVKLVRNTVKQCYSELRYSEQFTI